MLEWGFRHKVFSVALDACSTNISVLKQFMPRVSWRDGADGEAAYGASTRGTKLAICAQLVRRFDVFSPECFTHKDIESAVWCFNHEDAISATTLVRTTVCARRSTCLSPLPSILHRVRWAVNVLTGSQNDSVTSNIVSSAMFLVLPVTKQL